jgi:hypothetical protein
MVLFTNKYFPIYSLLSAPDFLIRINPAQKFCLLQSITDGLPCPFSRVRFEECTHASYFSALCHGFK